MKILLVGATGSMGKTVEELCRDNEKFEITAGIGLEGDNNRYPLYKDFKNIEEDVDIVLDFSNHNLIEDILDYSVKNSKPLVISTTGYSSEEIKAIEEASNKIPILFSGNMSLGINLLLNIVENLSKSLEDFNIEIIEKHHNQKKDSPSGTARMLLIPVNKGRDNKLFEEFGRDGSNLTRKDNEVGVHSIRGGTIVGEHTVLFSGLDEILEITHKAQSKKIFALGALKACAFIGNQSNGLYDMKDIFNI